MLVTIRCPCACSVPEKGLPYLVLLVSRMLTAGRGRACRRVVGDGAQSLKKLMKWMDHGGRIEMIIICRRNVGVP